MKSKLKSTRRFSSRVEAYERSRPSYPSALYDVLLAQLPHAVSVIAELGSGTGIFTEELLRRGHRVFGVEPDEAMRGAAERALSEWHRFESVAGKAEDTELESGSVDLVVSGEQVLPGGEQVPATYQGQPVDQSSDVDLLADCPFDRPGSPGVA